MKYSNREFLYKLYKRVTLGKVQKKLSLLDLKKSGYTHLIKPVFVVSTGRCRTHWLTGIFGEQKNVFVQHQPEISFLEEGKLLYEELGETGVNKILEQIVCTARDHLWLDCAKRNLRYIETNNRITFALSILKRLIPGSVFIHVTRHPVDFIRSGRNRKWYQGNSHDLGRIVMKDIGVWNLLNLNQKIGWLWLETNKFILENTQDLEANRILRVASEDLDFKRMEEIFTFMGLNPRKLSKAWFGKVTNIQKNNLNVSNQKILEDIQKNSILYDEIKEMARRFNYSL